MALELSLRQLVARHGPRHSPALLLLAGWSLWLVACTVPAAPAAKPTLDAPTTAPTLDDFWTGQAYFTVEIEETGLPMGESDTIILEDGSWRSYVHASHPSLGVLDQCGAPVEFPGCLVTFSSTDQGRSFAPTLNAAGLPVCQIPCTQCPCDSRRDHIDQQQYPRVVWLSAKTGKAPAMKRSAVTAPEVAEELAEWLLVYEYRANTILRRSPDGLAWSPPAEVPLTGIWQQWLMPCPSTAAVGAHPFTPQAYDCLIGSPPGIYVDQHANPPELYLFVGLGQNPSGMGCYRGPVNAPPSLLRACGHNPLFVGASDYGPTDTSSGSAANAHFDFRTISSAEVVRVGTRYYIFYEGVRGPGPGDQGDTQFLLGLARSTTSALDGPWELFAGNPILLDLPGNVGVGHADVVVTKEATLLYTSLDGKVRSRLRLVWH